MGSIEASITPEELVCRTADRLLERWDVLSQFPWSPREDSLDSLRAGSRVERVAAEIAAQGLFNLRAVGTASPAWEVWVAARADESTLSFSRSLRELRDCLEAVFEAEEAMERVENDEEADEASEALNELQQFRDDIDLPTEVRYWSDDAYMTAEDPLHGHPWAGSRVALCGVIQPTPFLSVISESAFEPGPVTLERARNLTLPLFSSDQAGQPAFSGEARAWMGGISAEASDIAAGLLLDAPELRCAALPVAAWPDGAFVRWEAFDWPSETWVALSDLSQAQGRWVDVAIRLALREGTHPTILFIDEPEAALHPRAERHLRSGLAALACKHHISTVVASHSAELLNDDAFLLHHVRRTSAFTSVERLQAVSIEALEDLGLDMSDLLQSYRVFLLVEGRHDVAVLRAFAGDALDEARTCLLPMRGIRELRAIAEARLLLDYTSASIAVAVDNAPGKVLIELWASAKALATAGEVEEALRLIHESLHAGSGEMQRIREFCARAIELGEWHRFAIYGLEERDIVEYVDHAVVVPGSKSWSNLRTQYKANSNGLVDFKAWLVTERGARFDDDTLQNAVATLDAVPPDVVGLVDLCKQLAGPRRGKPAASPDSAEVT